MGEKFLKVSVDEALKTDVSRLAKMRGQTEAKFLRSLVLAEVNRNQDSTDAAIKPAGKIDTHQMTLRMPHFLLDGIKERASKKCMSLSRFVSSLIQTHLLRAPVMTTQELAVLAESNRELIAIGRNLNQIAHALNAALRREGVIPFNNLNPEVIGLVRSEVLENRRLIRALTRSSLNAWEDNNDND
jgi:predicted DNA binding CopG/RHH family protein